MRPISCPNVEKSVEADSTGVFDNVMEGTDVTDVEMRMGGGSIFELQGDVGVSENYLVYTNHQMVVRLARTILDDKGPHSATDHTLRMWLNQK
jgi:hypothetical protein